MGVGVLGSSWLHLNKHYPSMLVILIKTHYPHGFTHIYNPIVGYGLTLASVMLRGLFA